MTDSVAYHIDQETNFIPVKVDDPQEDGRNIFYVEPQDNPEHLVIHEAICMDQLPDGSFAYVEGRCRRWWVWIALAEAGIIPMAADMLQQLKHKESWRSLTSGAMNKDSITSSIKFSGGWGVDIGPNHSIFIEMPNPMTNEGARHFIKEMEEMREDIYDTMHVMQYQLDNHGFGEPQEGKADAPIPF
jgi:hypothetical protein